MCVVLSFGLFGNDVAWVESSKSERGIPQLFWPRVLGCALLSADVADYADIRRIRSVVFTRMAYNRLLPFDAKESEPAE